MTLGLACSARSGLFPVPWYAEREAVGDAAGDCGIWRVSVNGGIQQWMVSNGKSYEEMDDNYRGTLILGNLRVEHENGLI